MNARHPSLRRLWWRTLARGIVTGAANDDPSAIATFAGAGAAFGPAVLWVAPACFPPMVASLSAYIYSWQKNQEVEEKLAPGRVAAEQRAGATRLELRRPRAPRSRVVFVVY